MGVKAAGTRAWGMQGWLQQPRPGEKVAAPSQGHCHGEPGTYCCQGPRARWVPSASRTPVELLESR